MFDNGNNSFRQNVEETVWNATAPVLNIQVHAASPSEGITSPNGRYSVKQKIPFLVQFTVESAYFGFVRWMAYNAGTMQPLGPEVVEFSDPGSLETNVTVHVAAGDILIQPLCSDRPAVQTTVPNNYNIGSNAAMRNQPFVVKFNKAIDRSSFQFPDGSWEKMEGGVKQFMNIDFSTPMGASLNHLFNAPTFDNDRTVRFNLVSQFSSNTDVVVTISREVHDSAGVTMGNNYMVEYFVGTNVDTSVPYLAFLALAAPDGDPLLFDQTGSNIETSPGLIKDNLYDSTAVGNVARRRYRDTVPLALIGEDPVDGQYINGYRIYARQVFDASGNAVAGPQYQPGTMISRANDTTHALTVKCRDGRFTGIDNDDLITYVEYDISSSAYFQNGVIELEITVYDQNGLVSNTYLVYVIKDITAPALSDLGTITPYSGLHFDNAAGRWFNGTNSSLELHSSQTEPLESERNGYPLSGITGVPRPHSGTVQWRFRLGASGTPTPYMNWTGGSPYTVTGSFGVSGSYDVYAQLRDDLGNESGWQQVTIINIDTAAPAIGAVADADIVRIGNDYTVTVTAVDANTAVEDITLTVTGLNSGGFSTVTNTFSAMADVVSGNGTPTLVLKKTAAPDGTDPKKGSAVFAFTLNNTTLPPPVPVEAVPPAPVSGDYRLSVIASDKVENDNTAVPLTRDFRHDTRPPVFVDYPTVIPGGYVVVNGNTWPGNNSQNAFFRTLNPGVPATEHREFFIKGRNFRIVLDAADRDPDAGGIGLAAAGFVTDTEYSSHHDIRYSQTAAAADGPVSMGWGAGNLAFSADDRKYMRINLFARDAYGNNRYYPSVSAMPAPRTDNTTAADTIDNSAAGPDGHFGPNDFYVYYDGAAPVFNMDPSLTNASVFYDTTLAGAGGTGSTAVRFYQSSGAVGLAVNSAQDAASTNVAKASGLKRWGWSTDGGTSYTYTDFSDPANGTDGTGLQSTGAVSITVKDADADSLPAAPGAANFSSFRLYLEDNAGNSAVRGLGAGAGAEYFILDNTAPSVGSVSIRNGSALRNPSLDTVTARDSDGSGDDGGVYDTAFFNTDPGMDYASRFTTGTVTVYLNDVVENGSGVEKIKLTLDSAEGVALGGGETLGVTLKGAALASGDFTVGGTGNTRIITLHNPRRFSPAETNRTITVTGLSIDNLSGSEGKSFTVKAKLTDKLGSAPGTPVTGQNSLIVGVPGISSNSGGDTGRYTLVNNSTGMAYVDTSDPAAYKYHTNGTVDITVPGVNVKSGLAQFELIVLSAHPAALADLNGIQLYKGAAPINRADYWWIVTRENTNTYHHYVRFKPAAGLKTFANEDLVIKNFKLNSGAGSYRIEVSIHSYLGSDNQTLTLDPDPSTAGTGDRDDYIVFDMTAPVLSPDTSDTGKKLPVVESAGKKYVYNLTSGVQPIQAADPDSGGASAGLLGYRFVVTASDTPASILQIPPNPGTNLGGSSFTGWSAWDDADAGVTRPVWPATKTASGSREWNTNYAAVNNSDISGTVISLLDTTDARNVFFLVTDRAGNVSVHNVFGGKVLKDATPPVFDNSDAGAHPSTIRNFDDINYHSSTHSSGDAVYRVWFQETGSGIKSISVGGFSDVTAVSADSGAGNIPLTWAKTGAAPNWTITFTDDAAGDYPATAGSNWGYIEIAGTLPGSVPADDGSKPVSVAAAADAAANTAVTLPYTRSIIRDTTAPSAVALDLPGGTGYFGSSMQVTYTENGAGPLRVTFTSDTANGKGDGAGLFTPSASGITVGGMPVTGASVTGSSPNFTVNLPDNPNLQGSGKVLIIPGTMSEDGTVSVTAMADRVGNAPTLTGIDRTVKVDTAAPGITGLAFTGQTWTSGGQGELYITFDEWADGGGIQAGSGLREVTLGGDKFTGSTDADIEVRTGSGGGTLLTHTGPDQYDYNFSTGVLTIKDDTLALSGGGKTLRIKGALPDPQGTRTVAITGAKDRAGNSSSGPFPSGASITRDTVKPAFISGTALAKGAGAQDGYTNADQVTYTVNFTEITSGLHSFTLDGFTAGSITGVTLGGTSLTDPADYTLSGSTVTLTNTVTSTGTGVTLSVTGTVPLGSSGDPKTVKISAAADRAGNAADASGGTVNNTSATVTWDTVKPVFSGAAIKGANTGAQDGWTNGIGVIYTVDFTDVTSGLHSFTLGGFDTITAATLGVNSIMSYWNSGTFTFTFPANIFLNTTGTDVTLSITGTVPPGAMGDTKTVRITAAADRAGNGADASGGTVNNTDATVTFDTSPPVFSGAAIKGANTGAQNGWTNDNGVIYTVQFFESDANDSGLHSFTLGGFDTITAATLGVTVIMPYLSGSTFTLPDTVTSNDTGAITLSITGTVPSGAAAMVSVTAAADRAGNNASSLGVNTSATVTFDASPPVFSNPAVKGTNTGAQDGWTNDNGVIYTVQFTEAASTSGLHSLTLDGLDTVTAATLGGTPIMPYLSGSTFTLPDTVLSTGTGVTLSITGTVPSGSPGDTKTVRISAAADRAGNDAQQTSPGTVDDTDATVTWDTDKPVFSGAVIAGSGGQKGWTNGTGVVYSVNFTEAASTSGLHSFTLDGFTAGSITGVALDGTTLTNLTDYTLSGSTVTLKDTVTSGGASAITLSVTGTVPSGTTATVKISAAADRAGNDAQQTVPGTVDDTTATVTFDAAPPGFTGAGLTGYGAETGLVGIELTNALYEVTLTETGSGLHTVTVNGFVSGSLDNFKLGGTVIPSGDMSYSDNTITFTQAATAPFTGLTASSLVLSFTGTLPDTASVTVSISAVDMAGHSVSSAGSVTKTRDTAVPVFGSAAIKGPAAEAQNGYTNSLTGVVYSVNFTEAASTSGLHSFTLDGFDTITGVALGGIPLTASDYTLSGSTVTLANTVTSSGAGPITLSVTGTITGSATVKITNALDRAGNPAAQTNSAGTVDDTGAAVTFDMTSPAIIGTAALKGAGASKPGYYSALTGLVYEVDLSEGEGLYQVTVSGFNSITSSVPAWTGSPSLSGTTWTVTFPAGTTITGGTLSLTGDVTGSSATVSITKVSDRAGNSITGTPVSGTSVTAARDNTAPVIDAASNTALVDGIETGVADYSTGKVVWRFKFTEAGSGINAVTLSDDVFAGSSVKYHISGNAGEYDTTAYSTGTYNSGTKKITFGSDWLAGTSQYLYIAGLLKDTADGSTATLSLASFTDGAGNDATTMANATKTVTVDREGPEVSGDSVNAAGTGFTGVVISDAGSGFTLTVGTTAKLSVSTGSPVISGADPGPYTISSGTAPTMGSDVAYTLQVTDTLGNTRTWGSVVSTTDGSSWLVGSWSGTGTSGPTPTLNVGLPFMAPPSGPSSGSGRINGYYSTLINSNARNGGAGNRVPGLPVSYTGRTAGTPARDGGRARISYTGASTGAELREMYRNLESSARSSGLPLRELVQTNGATEAGNLASLSVERNLVNRRSLVDDRNDGMNDAGRKNTVTRTDAGNAGNPVNVNGEAGGGNAADPGLAGPLPQAMILLPPLTGDTGEGVPPREGRYGQDNAGERIFLDPQLKPWNHERKAGARRRLKY